MPSPPRLYKYQGLTTRTLQNIKGQVLYFGSPLKLNDPYDCTLTPHIKVPSDEDIEDCPRWYLQERTLNKRQRYEFETFGRERLREILLRNGHNTLREVIQGFLATSGVTCFSECNDDLLMWGHYGGGYKGVCLEFSTAVEPFSEISKIKQVHYARSLPVLDVVKILRRELDIVGELFCTKSMAWSYEREWRAIHSTAGTEYVYPAEALTGVYFGPDIEDTALEIVSLILAGQNESVRLWKGSRSSTEFRVTFEEFKYTSHLQAKRMGLT
jgi:hypothetical protein